MSAARQRRGGTMSAARGRSEGALTPPRGARRVSAGGAP